MTAADWAKPPFDIEQMGEIRYSLPDEIISAVPPGKSAL